MFNSAEDIGVIFQNGTGRHVNGLDGISMVWKYDRAFFESRKDPVCHPLDRNRLQPQDTEAQNHGEVNAWGIDWEEQMMSLQCLQFVKAWENIYGIFASSYKQVSGS